MKHVKRNQSSNSPRWNSCYSRGSIRKCLCLESGNLKIAESPRLTRLHERQMFKYIWNSMNSNSSKLCNNFQHAYNTNKHFQKNLDAFRNSKCYECLLQFINFNNQHYIFFRMVLRCWRNSFSYYIAMW